MRTKIYIGLLLIVIFSLSTLISVPDLLSILTQESITQSIPNILKTLSFNIVGLIIGLLFYKTGLIDFKSSKKIPGQSFKDIVN